MPVVVDDKNTPLSLNLQPTIDVANAGKTVSLYPRYEVYRGYIVFAFSVIMFVCLSVCLSVNFFFRQRFLSNFLG